MITVIARRELKSAFSTPVAWITIAAGLALLCWLLFTQLEVYLKIQPQLMANQSSMGIWALVITPTLSVGALVILLLTPLLGMHSISSELQSNRISLYLSSPVSALEFVLGKWLGLTLSITPLILLIMAAGLAVQSGSYLDPSKFLSSLTGLMLLAGMAAAITVWLSSLTRQPLIAGALAYGVLFLMWLMNADKNPDSSLGLFALTAHLEPFFKGLLVSHHIWYFLSLTLTALTLATHKMWRLAGGR